MNKEPNLFIVGAAKSGTSSLWYLLKQHPNIFMPDEELGKEPAYYSELKRSFDIHKYFALFQKAKDQKYIGEASTAYLTDPSSAVLIHKAHPQAKIIILLRNPIHRAYSLYNWMVQEGYEYARTFEDALTKEKYRRIRKIPNFFEPEYYFNYLYVESGKYSNQIERYMRLFGPRNVFIGLFEDFIVNTEAFLLKLFNFLGLSIHSSFTPEIKNPSRSVIHPYLTFGLRKIIQTTYPLERKNLIPKFMDKSRRDSLMNLGLRQLKPTSIRAETYQQLSTSYIEEYSRLGALFDLDLSPWK